MPPLVLQAQPGVSGLVLHGDPPTLACHQVDGAMHRFAVANRCAGREPELDDPATLAQIGRFIGRLHAVGRRRPFVHRHHLDPRADGQRALTLLLEGDFVPPTELPAWRAACERALAMAAAAFDAAVAAGHAAPARRLPPRQRALARHRAECRRPRRRHARPGGAGPVDAGLGRCRHDGAAAQYAAGRLRAVQPTSTTVSAGSSSRCARCAWCATAPGWPSAGATRPSRSTFPFFGTAAYWNQQTTQLREQIEAMAS